MSNRLKYVIAIAAGLALAGLMLLTHTARSQVTVNSPIGTSTVVGASSAQIIPANPSRRSISLCCGSSATNTCAIAPLGITPSTGATGVGIQLAAGACFTPPNNQMYSGSGGGSTNGWNGIGSAASVSIIVLEWL